MDAIHNDSACQQKGEIERHLLQEQNVKNNNFSLQLTEESCFSLR